MWSSHVLLFLEGGVSTEIIWNSSVWNICLFPPFINLFSNLFISVWTHGNILAYNVILPYSSCSNCSGFSCWDLFQLVPVPLWHEPIDVLCCFTFWHYSRLILHTSCPSSRVNSFSRDSWFLWLEKSIGPQDLSARCGHYVLSSLLRGVISFRPSLLTERYICLYVNLGIYTYLEISLHVTINIYIKLNMSSYWYLQLYPIITWTIPCNRHGICVYHILFIPSSISGHLGCFHSWLLWIMLL